MPLATHTGILSCVQSTRPLGHASAQYTLLLYHALARIHRFGVTFEPRTFSAHNHSTSELLRTL